MNENIVNNPNGIAGQYRQGDLLIERVPAVPTGLVGWDEDRVVARGEKTGHKHELTSGKVYRGPRNECYFTLDEEASLNHEEHPTVGLPAGSYRVTMQRQYNPREAQRAHRVMD